MSDTAGGSVLGNAGGKGEVRLKDPNADLRKRVTPFQTKPVYADLKAERKRLLWIMWRNRLYRLLRRKDVATANMLMDYFWPFPVGDRLK